MFYEKTTSYVVELTIRSIDSLLIEPCNTLILSNNEIGDAGLRDVTEFLRDNQVASHQTFLLVSVSAFAQTIAKRNLHHNRIGLQGAQYLSDVLQQNEVRHNRYYHASDPCYFISTSSHRHLRHWTYPTMKSVNRGQNT